MAIKKAETTRISIVLENSMLQILDYVAKDTNETRSEIIRELLDERLDELLKQIDSKEKEK